MTPLAEFAFLRTLQRNLRFAEVMYGTGKGSLPIRRHIIKRMAVLALVVAAGSAGAHSFYPAWCCAGHDCAPLESRRVKAVAGGYLVDGKFMVPMNEVRRSQDEQYHACFPQPEKLRCFFAPPFGS